MRPAIKDIFHSWKRSLLIISLLSTLIAFTALEENTSFKKIEDLQRQQALIESITDLDRKDLEYSIIQTQGKSEMLLFLYDRLHTLDDYDLIGKAFTTDGLEYHEDLNILKEMLEAFTHQAKRWYSHDDIDLVTSEKALRDARARSIAHIDHMIAKNSTYDHAKSKIQQTLIYVTLFFILIHLITFLRRSAMILKDIDSLHLVNAQGSPYTPVTDEVTIISKRMHRRASIAEDPSLIDDVTEISNLKGLLSAYNSKKSVKDGAYVGVATFQVDRLDEFEHDYSAAFIRTLLKKIAFMISLYQQPADIVGRTGHSQFTVVFTRHDRDQALTDCRLIMKSVEETAFKTPHGDELSLTLSASFTPKHSNVSLDESMEHTQQALEKTDEEGPNRLIQI